VNLGHSLGVINSPDSLGTACNYQANVISTSTNPQSSAGFPNFIDGGLNSKKFRLHDLVFCNTFITGDTADAGSGFNHYYWSTGDTTQKITINNPGTYWVNVTNSNGCIASDTMHAYIISPSNFNILHDTIVCTTYGNYYANTYRSGILNYSWSDGGTNPTNTFTMSGVYWIDYTFSGGCVVRDSFKLTLFNKPIVNFGTGLFCYENTTFPIVLDAGAGNGYTYLWSNGATTETISVNNNGQIGVTVTSPGVNYPPPCHLMVV